mgnify:FL=1
MHRHSLTLRLSIPAEEMLRLYRGSARDVLAVADDGQSVRFPADILRRFVGHDGVHGHFRIDVGEDGRFLAIERLNP